MTFRSRPLPVMSVALLLLASASAASGSSTPSPAPVAGCARDTVPPQVMSLSLSPRSVDVTATSATIGVQVHVVDLAATGVPPSGVRSVKASVEFRLRSGSATQFLRLRPSSDLVTWGGKLVVPAWCTARHVAGQGRVGQGLGAQLPELQRAVAMGRVPAGTGLADDGRCRRQRPGSSAPDDRGRVPRSGADRHPRTQGHPTGRDEGARRRGGARSGTGALPPTTRRTSSGDS